jgi:hypothetical protein
MMIARFAAGRTARIVAGNLGWTWDATNGTAVNGTAQLIVEADRGEILGSRR